MDELVDATETQCDMEDYTWPPEPVALALGLAYGAPFFGGFFGATMYDDSYEPEGTPAEPAPAVTEPAPELAQDLDAQEREWLMRRIITALTTERDKWKAKAERLGVQLPSGSERMTRVAEELTALANHPARSPDARAMIFATVQTMWELEQAKLLLVSLGWQKRPDLVPGWWLDGMRFIEDGTPEAAVLAAIIAEAAK